MKKSQEGTKDCQREPPNMQKLYLLVRYPNHKFSNYGLTDLNKIILIVRYVIDVNFGYLCLYSTNDDDDEYKQSSIAADQTFSKSKIKYSLFFHIIYSYYNKIQGNSIIHE